ncbi:hypothetical protein ACLVWU_08455 [Bdellovibrio sp. HCB290]|uniref:hypothetical protein n=1 Tax=Bdellovibrio sp. HCB290 TaxID=3394356 RepID=UPI0039B3E7F2
MSNEKQIKTINRCLYGAALVQILSTGFVALKAMQFSPEQSLVSPIMSVFGMSGVYLAVILVAVHFVTKGLKEKSGWSWVGAVSILILTAASFALPLCIVGLLTLFKKENREVYLAQLDL